MSANGRLKITSIASRIDRNVTNRSRSIKTDCDRADNHQPGHRALLIFKLPSPRGEISRWQCDLILDGFFGFSDISADIPVANIDLDTDAAQPVLSADLHRTLELR